MARLSNEEWENRFRKLIHLWSLRQQGHLREDQIAQELSFLTTVGEPSATAMYEQLLHWGLPDWLVYPSGGSERAEINKERKANDTEEVKERKARGTGEAKDLPPAGRAVNLFRKDLERLTYYLNQLPALREQLQAERFVISFWVGEDWEYDEKSEFSAEQWKALCERYGEDPNEDIIRRPINPIGPGGASPTPWEGLISLIAVHAIMYESVDRLIDLLHPDPSSMDKENLYKKRGAVDEFLTSAKNLAKEVRGGLVRRGKPSPGVPDFDHWVAWFLIAPLSEKGYSDEQIYADIRSKFRSLGKLYPVAEVTRLRELHLPPPEISPPEKSF